MDMNEIVRTAVDAYHGNVQKYSVGESQEALHNALVELNGGSTKLDYRKIRDGECKGMFALIEQILGRTVVDGLTDSDFFNSFVDFRNVAEGDQPVFTVKDSNLYDVAVGADGTQAIRRQRLSGVTETTIPTRMHYVRIYEELNRILSGRVDFNEMISDVSDSFAKQILGYIYSLWVNATQAQLGGQYFYPAAGSYSANALLQIIEMVEAASGGQQATIIGTKAALRNLAEAVQSDGAKEELHNWGYYGKFYGTPCVAIPQRFKTGLTGANGTNDFQFSDKSLAIVAGADKPIKFVYEGNPLIINRAPENNMDLTQEYLYGMKYGAGIVLAGANAGIGRYDIT